MSKGGVEFLIDKRRLFKGRVASLIGFCKKGIGFGESWGFCFSSGSWNGGGDRVVLFPKPKVHNA